MKELLLKVFLIGAIVSLILIPFTNGLTAAPCLIFGGAFAVCLVIFG